MRLTQFQALRLNRNVIESMVCHYDCHLHHDESDELARLIGEVRGGYSRAMQMFIPSVFLLGTELTRFYVSISIIYKAIN